MFSLIVIFACYLSCLSFDITSLGNLPLGSLITQITACLEKVKAVYGFQDVLENVIADLDILRGLLENCAAQVETVRPLLEETRTGLEKLQEVNTSGFLAKFIHQEKLTEMHKKLREAIQTDFTDTKCKMRMIRDEKANRFWTDHFTGAKVGFNEFLKALSADIGRTSEFGTHESHCIQRRLGLQFNDKEGDVIYASDLQIWLNKHKKFPEDLVWQKLNYDPQVTDIFSKECIESAFHFAHSKVFREFLSLKNVSDLESLVIQIAKDDDCLIPPVRDVSLAAIAQRIGCPKDPKVLTGLTLPRVRSKLSSEVYQSISKAVPLGVIIVATVSGDSLSDFPTIDTMARIASIDRMNIHEAESGGAGFFSVLRPSWQDSSVSDPFDLNHYPPFQKFFSSNPIPPQGSGLQHTGSKLIDSTKEYFLDMLLNLQPWAELISAINIHLEQTEAGFTLTQKDIYLLIHQQVSVIERERMSELWFRLQFKPLPLAFPVFERDTLRTTVDLTSLHFILSKKSSPLITWVGSPSVDVGQIYIDVMKKTGKQPHANGFAEWVGDGTRSLFHQNSIDLIPAAFSHKEAEENVHVLLHHGGFSSEDPLLPLLTSVSDGLIIFIKTSDVNSHLNEIIDLLLIKRSVTSFKLFILQDEKKNDDNFSEEDIYAIFDSCHGIKQPQLYMQPKNNPEYYKFAHQVKNAMKFFGNTSTPVFSYWKLIDKLLTYPEAKRKGGKLTLYVNPSKVIHNQDKSPVTVLIPEEKVLQLIIDLGKIGFPSDFQSSDIFPFLEVGKELGLVNLHLQMVESPQYLDNEERLRLLENHTRLEDAWRNGTLHPLVEKLTEIIRKEDIELYSTYVAWMQAQVIPQTEHLVQLIHEKSQQKSTDSEFVRLCEELERKVVPEENFGKELLTYMGKPLSHLNERILINEKQLARFAAKLFLANNKIELLDGETLVMNQKFMLQVANELNNFTTDVRFVVIVGDQKTYKSTLLNAVFGTRFPIGAVRTTKGIYASYFLTLYPNVERIVILDTEGIHALQANRPKIFDSKMAMLCLLMADILIINGGNDHSKPLIDTLQNAVVQLKQHNLLGRSHFKTFFTLHNIPKKSFDDKTPIIDRMQSVNASFANVSASSVFQSDNLWRWQPFGTPYIYNTLGEEYIMETKMFREKIISELSKMEPTHLPGWISSMSKHWSELTVQYGSLADMVEEHRMKQLAEIVQSEFIPSFQKEEVEPFLKNISKILQEDLDTFINNTLDPMWINMVGDFKQKATNQGGWHVAITNRMKELLSEKDKMVNQLKLRWGENIINFKVINEVKAAKNDIKNKIIQLDIEATMKEIYSTLEPNNKEMEIEKMMTRVCKEPTNMTLVLFETLWSDKRNQLIKFIEDLKIVNIEDLESNFKSKLTNDILEIEKKRWDWIELDDVQVKSPLSEEFIISYIKKMKSSANVNANTGDHGNPNTDGDSKSNTGDGNPNTDGDSKSTDGDSKSSTGDNGNSNTDGAENTRNNANTGSCVTHTGNRACDTDMDSGTTIIEKFYNIITSPTTSLAVLNELNPFKTNQQDGGNGGIPITSPTISFAELNTPKYSVYIKQVTKDLSDMLEHTQCHLSLLDIGTYVDQINKILHDLDNTLNRELGLMMNNTLRGVLHAKRRSLIIRACENKKNNLKNSTLDQFDREKPQFTDLYWDTLCNVSKDWSMCRFLGSQLGSQLCQHTRDYHKTLLEDDIKVDRKVLFNQVTEEVFANPSDYQRVFNYLMQTADFVQTEYEVWFEKEIELRYPNRNTSFQNDLQKIRERVSRWLKSNPLNITLLHTGLGNLECLESFHFSDFNLPDNITDWQFFVKSFNETFQNETNLSFTPIDYFKNLTMNARGCKHRCPLCGQKCHLDENHGGDHSTKHHLSLGFQGWTHLHDMSPETEMICDVGATHNHLNKKFISASQGCVSFDETMNITSFLNATTDSQNKWSIVPKQSHSSVQSQQIVTQLFSVLGCPLFELFDIKHANLSNCDKAPKLESLKADFKKYFKKDFSFSAPSHYQAFINSFIPPPDERVRKVIEAFPEGKSPLSATTDKVVISFQTKSQITFYYLHKKASLCDRIGFHYIYPPNVPSQDVFPNICDEKMGSSKTFQIEGGSQIALFIQCLLGPGKEYRSDVQPIPTAFTRDKEWVFVGFEDLIDEPNSDKDFNDVIITWVVQGSWTAKIPPYDGKTYLIPPLIDT